MRSAPTHTHLALMLYKVRRPSNVSAIAVFWVESVLFHPLMGLAEENALPLCLHLSYTACLECTDVSFWERASWSVHTHTHKKKKSVREEKRGVESLLFSPLQIVLFLVLVLK